MKTYLVGGAVRDRLLGLSPSVSGSDRDWVVVGGSVAQMLAEGYQHKKLNLKYIDLQQTIKKKFS